MLPISLEQIDEAFLQNVCEEGWPESQTLEFKRELPGKLDQDKHEICKDVVALANADGGDLVYGIEEKAGVAGSIAPVSTEPADAASRRINQVLDAGIEPRIHGLRILPIVVSGGYVLILRIPASYDGPHCIRTNNKNRRFVMRNGSGVMDMSFDQIRGAFDRTATLAEQARRFISNRRQLIIEEQAALPLRSGSQFVLHIVPIAGQAGRKTVDLKPIYDKSYLEFFRHNWGGGSRIYNIDGLLVHSGKQGDEGFYGYNQIFRNGALEGVQHGGSIQNNLPGNQRPVVWSSDLSIFYYYSLIEAFKALKDWGFTGPALLWVGILNVKGFELQTGNRYYPFRRATTADRHHLIPPEIWIEDVESVDTDGLIGGIIRPLLDTLWQAFGLERCFDFNDTTGEFAPPN